jgi:hypothetical protein
MIEITNERRIEIEKIIVAKTVETLIAAGFQVSVNNGEEITVRRSTDAAAVCAALGTTDEDSIHLRKADGVRAGFVLFVYGNEGNTVICDHSTSLEDVLAPVYTFAETFDAEIYGIK